jgi:hypothetical protein
MNENTGVKEMVLETYIHSLKDYFIARSYRELAGAEKKVASNQKQDFSR